MLVFCFLVSLTFEATGAVVFFLTPGKWVKVGSGDPAERIGGCFLLARIGWWWGWSSRRTRRPAMAAAARARVTHLLRLLQGTA